MPYHPPFVVGNTSYDLAHLDPMTFGTPSAKLGRVILTRCRFTTHTFTEAAPDGYAGPIREDEGRRPRVFCPARYALSHQLPKAVRLPADPERYVWEGAHERNWLHRSDVIVAGDADVPVTYQVFFAVKKAPRAGACDVEMVVESAYAFDPLRQPKVVGRAKIIGLLTATVGRGEKVAHPAESLKQQRRPKAPKSPGYCLRAALHDHRLPGQGTLSQPIRRPERHISRKSFVGSTWITRWIA